jgi:WD40 repeat protein
MKTGRELLRLTGHSGGLHRVAFAPNGRLLTTGGRDLTVKLWDVSPTGGRDLLTIAAHDGNVYDVVYSPDGTKIATAGEDGAVKLWDAVDGRLLLDLPGQIGWVHYPAFSPDGKRLAAAARAGGVTVWDAETGSELLSLIGDAPAFTPIDFSPDGSGLAAGGLDGVAHIWDAKTGERLVTFRSGEDTIMALDYLDDAYIATLDRKGRITTWIAATGERVCVNSRQTDVFWDAEPSPDGRFLAAASWDGTASVFRTLQFSNTSDVVSGLVLCSSVPLHVLQGHAGNVTGVSFNPDGTVLATSGFDGTTRLWDMEMGTEMLTLSGHALPASAVDFSPDGRYLVTAGADGTLRVSILAIDQLMELARSRLSRSLTRAECRRYLHLPSCPEE